MMIIWLVVSTLWKIWKSVGMIFPIYGKQNHVPNHQSVMVYDVESILVDAHHPLGHLGCPNFSPKPLIRNPKKWPTADHAHKRWWPPHSLSFGSRRYTELKVVDGFKWFQLVSTHSQSSNEWRDIYIYMICIIYIFIYHIMYRIYIYIYDIYIYMIYIYIYIVCHLPYRKWDQWGCHKQHLARSHVEGALIFGRCHGDDLGIDRMALVVYSLVVLSLPMFTPSRTSKMELATANTWKIGRVYTQKTESSRFWVVYYFQRALFERYTSTPMFLFSTDGIHMDCQNAAT